MIPMEITPEEYATYFPPAPDYLLVQRVLLNYEAFGKIQIPDMVRQGSMKFTSIGKLLAVSEYESEDPFVERMKDIYKTCTYVMFSFHATADCTLMPQFKLPRDVSIITLHAKDVIQIPKNLEVLLEKQAAFEKANSED